MRIWKKKGNADRKKADIANGGDFIKTGTEYDASLLVNNDTVTLFVEAVSHSSTSADQQIKIEIDHNGSSGTPGFQCTDALRVTIINANIVVSDVLDQYEWSKGGVVCLNSDNDDFKANPLALNYQSDLIQTKVKNENDLKKVTLTAQLAGITTGQVRFEITSGNSNIKVWHHKEKNNKLILSQANPVKNWTAQEFANLLADNHFYVEGISRSNIVKNVEIKLSYRADPADANPLCDDQVKYTVVDLFLDVDRNSAFTHDNPNFQPGYPLGGGNPVITAANNWRQHMELFVAPMNLGNGEKNLATSVVYKLDSCSNFYGVCSNMGNQSDKDYSFDANGSDLENAVTAISANARAVQEFYCKDYGGYTIVKAEIRRGSTVITTCEMRLPLDIDRDTLPDFFELAQANDPNRAAVAVFNPQNPKTAALPGIAAMPSAQWDRETQNPASTLLPVNGRTGDGLIAFEEYRGFYYGNAANTPNSHRHHRTSTHNKDVFVFSNVVDVNALATDMGLGYLLPPGGGAQGIAANIHIHRINNAEWTGTATREINFNRIGIAGATLQRAIYATSPAPPGFGDTGVARGGINTGPNGVCNTTVPNQGLPAVRLDFQVIPPNQGLANVTAIAAGTNGWIDPPVAASDRFDAANVRIVSNTADNHLHTLSPLGDDRVRGSVQGVGGNLSHITVTVINTADVLRGIIIEGADNKIEKNTVTSGGGNDDHSQLRIEPNGDGLQTAVDTNDVVLGGNIVPGTDNLLQSAANLAGNDLIRGEIREGADQVLNSRPANTNDVVKGTIEEGPDNNLQSRPAGGTTDFVIGHVDGGLNGYLDPAVNNASAMIAGSGGVPAVADDSYVPVTRTIDTGPDGIRNTNPQVGSDDVQVIVTAGNGTPFAYCVDPDDRDGTDEFAIDDVLDVAAGGDDVASNSNDTTDANSDPNDAVVAYVATTAYNRINNLLTINALGPPPTCCYTSVDCGVASGVAAQTARQNLIMRTAGHEIGHCMHLAHYNATTIPPRAPPRFCAVGTRVYAPAAGHTINGSLMSQTSTTAWNVAGNAPVNPQMDTKDTRQVRLHQKHP